MAQALTAPPGGRYLSARKVSPRPRGEVSWRGPFYGVAALMAIALIATVVLVEKTPKPPRKTGLSAPLLAYRIT